MDTLIIPFYLFSRPLTSLARQAQTDAEILPPRPAKAKSFYCLRVSAVKIFTYFFLIFSFAVCSPAKALPANDLDAVQSTIFAWRNAWQSKDIQRFMSFYSPDFQSKALDYPGLMRKKTRLFQSAGTLSVEISDLKIHIRGRRAVAKFLQRYQTPALTDVGKKTLILTNTNLTWKIISEEWQSLIEIDKAIKDPTVPSTPVQPMVKRIDFKIEADGAEKVFVSMDYFAVPRVMTLEGNKPRIAIDMENIRSWDGKPLINTNGKLVKQVRTHLYPNDKKLRIVLDLDPARNYTAKLTYQKSKNMYCMQVRSFSAAGKKTPPLEKSESAGRIIFEEWQPTEVPDRTTEVPPVPSPPDKPAVRGIDFKIEEDGAEKVIVATNHFALPKLLTLQGTKPRIALDFENISKWDEEPLVGTHGKLIRQIRSYLYRDEKRLRIVLDLNPDTDYVVKPTYKKRENTYSIHVRPLPDVREKTPHKPGADLTCKIISEEWKPVSEGEKTTEAPAIPSTSDALMVKRIDFKIEEDGGEKVFIAMNRFAVPEVMALEGKTPRIAIDIKNIASWDGKTAVEVNGKMIKQIRTHLHKDSNKLRIVLDLDPNADYSVNPTYYKSDNIYCIEVKPQ